MVEIAPRHRVMKAGTIEFGSGAIDCMVRNLSITGAALEVSNQIGTSQWFAVTGGDPSRTRVPTLSGIAEMVQQGVLLSYGQDIPDYIREAAGYVDKIRKGAKPADLPVEQPTRFKLAINLKTAKALGLTVPPSLLVTADEIIE
jgi:hypothetical protein